MPNVSKTIFRVTSNNFAKETNRLKKNWNYLAVRKEKYIDNADQTDKQKRMLYTIAKIAFAVAIISGLGAVYATSIYGASSLVVISLKISGVLFAGSGVIVGSVGLYIRHIQNVVLNILNHSGEVKSETKEMLNPEISLLIGEALINKLSYTEFTKRAKTLKTSVHTEKASKQIIDQIKAYAENGHLTTQDLVMYAQSQKTPQKPQNAPIIRKEHTKTFLDRLIEIAQHHKNEFLQPMIKYAQKENPLVTEQFLESIQAIHFLITAYEREEETNIEQFLLQAHQQNNATLSQILQNNDEWESITDIIIHAQNKNFISQELFDHAQAIRLFRDCLNNLTFVNIEPQYSEKAKELIAFATGRRNMEVENILNQAERADLILRTGAIGSNGITREDARLLISNDREKKECFLSAKNSENSQLKNLEHYARDKNMNIQQILEYAQKNRPLSSDYIQFNSTSFLTSMIGIGHSQFLELLLESTVTIDNEIQPFPSSKNSLRLSQLIDVPAGGALVVFRDAPDWDQLMNKNFIITNSETNEEIPFIENGKLHPKLRIVFPGEWLSSNYTFSQQIHQAFRLKATNPDQVFFTSEKLKEAQFFTDALSHMTAIENGKQKVRLPKRLKNGMIKMNRIFKQFLPNDVDSSDLAVRSDTIDHPDRPQFTAKAIFYSEDLGGEVLSEENSKQKPPKTYLITHPPVAGKIGGATFMSNTEGEREEAAEYDTIEWKTGRKFAYLVRKPLTVISYNDEGKRGSLLTFPNPRQLQ